MTDHHRHIQVLDGLRAIAIIAVLCAHSVAPYWREGAPFMPLGPVDFGNLLYNGWFGVDLFFVLSGFLITGQILAFADGRAETGENLRHYFRKRLFRILPMYYLTLGLVYFWDVKAASGWEWRSDYFFAMILMQDYVPLHSARFLWTIAVEVKFYLLAPLLVLGLARISAPALRYGAMAGLFMLPALLRVLTIVTTGPSADYESFFIDIRMPFHLSTDGLTAGMICAFLWHDPDIRRRLQADGQLANILFAAGLAGFLLLILPRPLFPAEVSLFGQTFFLTCLALSFASVMLGLLGGAAGHGFFANRIFRHIALVSYSLYLTHLLCLPVQNAAAAIFPGLDAYPALAWAAGFPLFFLTAVAVASICQRLVEKPFIRIGKQGSGLRQS